MITRRSFFTGLAAALVAPKIVPSVSPVIAGVDFGVGDMTTIVVMKARQCGMTEWQRMFVKWSIENDHRTWNAMGSLHKAAKAEDRARSLPA